MVLANRQEGAAMRLDSGRAAKIRPTIYTTGTGGIGVDVDELFTTPVGRQALLRLMEIEFPVNDGGSVSGAPDEMIERTPEAFL
jgi:hypothetical protein